MKYEVNRARFYFNKATESLNLDDKGKMYAARAMQHIYFRILEKIIDADYDVYNHEVSASKLEKIWISLGVWAKYRLVY